MLRSLLVVLVSLASAAGLHAQLPFSQNLILPTFSFSEQYAETLKFDAEFGYYTEASDALSPLTLTIRASSAGIDLGALNAATPYNISVGELALSGVLGDDPAYKAGATSVRIPITDEDWETEETIKVGEAVISWGDGTVTANVQINRPDTYGIAAYWYVGEGEPIDDVAEGRFLFADRLLERNVYFSGTSLIRTEIVGTGADAEEVEFYSVKITGGSDAERPTVKPTGLKNGSIVGEEVISITAQASDNRGVVAVRARVNNETIFTPLTQAVNQEWYLTNVALNYGDNAIRLLAIDKDGNESFINEFIVKRWTPVTISVSGNGKVTNDAEGTALYEVGSTVSLEATPNGGWVFSGWTGSLETSTASLIFQVQPGLSFTANFIPSPFVAVKGVYHGLVTSSDEGIGSVKLQLNRSGVFTAKITLNGRTEKLTGTFDATGSFTGVIAGNGSFLRVNLKVSTSAGADSLSGTIIDGANTYDLNGDRSVYTAQNPAPQAGYYTVSIPASDLAGTPRGDGFATMHVAKNGVAKAAGVLPDGTAFSFSAPVSKDGKLPLFASLYSGMGRIAGTVIFKSVPGVGDLSATAYWVREPNASPRGGYVNGFETEVELVGARYTGLRGVRVLELPIGGRAAVTLGEGGLATPLVNSVIVNANNRVIVTIGSVDQLLVKIAAPTGLFSGTFRDPVRGNLRRFTGVIMQPQNLGTGLFRSRYGTGFVSITPP